MGKVEDKCSLEVKFASLSFGHENTRAIQKVTYVLELKKPKWKETFFII